MRISKARLSKIEARAQEKIVIDEKAEELQRRMEAAQARVDKRYRDKLSPEEFELFVSSREEYYEVYHQKWAELCSMMPCGTLAEKFKVVDLASALAREKTGFREPDV